MRSSLGFRITDNKGFHITFANGFTVSVQFGGGNYSDNYNFPIGDERKTRGMESNSAECAVWGPDGDMDTAARAFRPDGSDTVFPRMNAAQVLELLNWAAKQP